MASSILGTCGARSAPSGGSIMTNGVPLVFSYTPSLVAFLDILGFRALTCQPTTEAEVSMAFVGQQLRQVALERSEHTHNRIAFDVRMFSDCICLIAEDSVIGAAALVDSVAYLSLTFANNRLLLRGGIARGRHFHSEDMVFSEALV